MSSRSNDCTMAVRSGLVEAGAVTLQLWSSKGRGDKSFFHPNEIHSALNDDNAARRIAKAVDCTLLSSPDCCMVKHDSDRRRLST